ncbi:unnamed protein product [Prorocentrum cordatum]|uniref:Uncharacterized protein n=1 Tax=Prorocentrum cordatum TaxID=2364126 RepID=A0ABN9SD43_9DINO|nr:unnamed protein product [Polarella glacialis]
MDPPPLVPFVPAHNFDAVEFRVTVASEPGEVPSQLVVSHIMEQILHRDKRGPAMRAFLVKYGVDPLAELPAAISSDVGLPLGPLELPPTTTPAPLPPGGAASLPMRPAPLAYSARGHTEEHQAPQPLAYEGSPGGIARRAAVVVSS